MNIDFEELENTAGDGILFAWGVHDVDEFLSEAIRLYGYEEDDRDRVRHVLARKMGPHGRFDYFYDWSPVPAGLGTANATVLEPW